MGKKRPQRFLFRKVFIEVPSITKKNVQLQILGHIPPEPRPCPYMGFASQNCHMFTVLTLHHVRYRFLCFLSPEIECNYQFYSKVHIKAINATPMPIYGQNCTIMLSIVSLSCGYSILSVLSPPIECGYRFYSTMYIKGIGCHAHAHIWAKLY